MDDAPFETWTRRRFGVVLGGLLPFALGLSQQDALAKKRHHKHTPTRQPITRQLAAVGNSGVSGMVTLRQLKTGTAISVSANGLAAGGEYLSLYYDNDHCALEPYSAQDEIGGNYVADAGGNGTTSGRADDDLDKIGSVSVRLASDFMLLACAVV